MTREQQLKFCKVCTKQSFDSKQGIICQLTEKRAEFKYECESFQEDPELKLKFENSRLKNEATKNIASQGKRFANYILDVIFLFLFTIGFSIFISIVLSIVAPSSLYLLGNNRALLYLMTLIVGMIYFVTLESLTGRTFAKFITKTKVVDEKGEKPGVKVIVLRSLVRFIPFEAFSFLGNEGNGWHDKASNTIVVEIK